LNLTILQTALNEHFVKITKHRHQLANSFHSIWLKKTSPSEPLMGMVVDEHQSPVGQDCIRAITSRFSVRTASRTMTPFNANDACCIAAFSRKAVFQGERVL
jgi:hypothetical protein